MPATVKVGMIRMLLDFKGIETIYFAVGRTTTPWADENNPPAETTDTEMLEEIAGLKKADSVSLCYPDPNGEIEFRGQRYELVDDSVAYDYDSRYLYCSAMLRFDEFPVVTFRQYGILVGVVAQSGYEGNDILLPEQVSDYGKLIGYVNLPPVFRTSTSKNLLEIVVELVPQVTS